MIGHIILHLNIILFMEHIANMKKNDSTFQWPCHSDLIKYVQQFYFLWYPLLLGKTCYNYLTLPELFKKKKQKQILALKFKTFCLTHHENLCTVAETEQEKSASIFNQQCKWQNIVIKNAYSYVNLIS